MSVATCPAVSEDVLANAGTFITFQTHYDTAQIQELIGLKEDQKKILGALQEGDCIIRVASNPHPFKLKIPLLRTTTNDRLSSKTGLSFNGLLLKPKSNHIIFVGYFHNVQGPQLFPFSALLLKKEDADRILAYMGQNSGLLDIKFDSDEYILDIFEIPSKWGRGKIELMLIGIKLDPKSCNGKKLNDFRSKLTSFVEICQNKENFYRVCYLQRSNDENYAQYASEIQEEFSGWRIQLRNCK